MQRSNIIHKWAARWLYVCIPLLFVGIDVQAGTGRDFSGQDLTNANFIHQNLQNANFSGANLRGAVFVQANLSGANFEKAILGVSDKAVTNFAHANLNGANFDKVRIKGTTKINLQYANISSANFKGLDTRKVLFGPILNFNTSATPPNFSKATLDCEFPWHFKQLNTQGATIPKCNNQLPLPADEKNTISVKDEGNAKTPQPASVVVYNLNKTTLSDAYKGATLPSGNNVFVDGTSGQDSSSCGTSYTAACQTISQGISNCSSLGTPCNVLIEFGRYSQTTTLALASGVSLIGGYVGGNPSSQYQSSIVGPAGGTAAISGANVTTTLQNLIVNGQASTVTNQPAIAAEFNGSTGSNITMDNVAINAGSGMNFSTVASTGTAVNGNNGASYDTPYASAGGLNTCAVANSAGGAGGTSWNITTSCSGWGGIDCSCTCSQSTTNSVWWGTPGNPGQSTAGGGSNAGSVPGTKACNWGGAGQNTLPGGAGGAGADASVQASFATSRIGNIDANGNWTPVVSDNGGNGLVGGGGGGGGAGQAVANLHCPAFKDTYADISNGAAGGGGGSGGCGATGGGGGTMGGASFAILLVNSTITLNSTSIITAAQGGQGGSGGPGVLGGVGGQGGANCSCLNSAGQAVTGCTPNCDGATQSGAGGNGGNGGASGGGAGGNGGPSIGVVLVGTSSFSNTQAVYPNTSGAVGTGGLGAGTAPAGASGQQGFGQATYVVPN